MVDRALTRSAISCYIMVYDNGKRFNDYERVVKMKPNSKKRSANRSGSVLVTAVAVLLIMSILMTATVGYVSVNRKKTNNNYCHKQAYLTASTTLKSIVTQIELETARPGVGTSTTQVEQAAKIAAIEALADAPGGNGTTVDVTYNGTTGADYGVGTTKINIAREKSGDGLVATAYSTYGGVTEQVAAHFFIEAKKKPVEFTNTVETLGSGSIDCWDNINTVGDTAVLNTEGNKVYVLQNDTNPRGSFFMYGSLIPNTAQMKFTLSSSMTDPKRGTTVQISGSYWGEIKAESTMARGDGFNYIFIGGTANFSRNSYVGTSATNAVDVITRRLIVDKGPDDDYNKFIKPLVTAGKIETWRADTMKQGANTYEQYGNIYVYKNGSDLTYNGDAIFNADTVKIHGDLNVEGNLYCNKGVYVDGTVNVGGNIINPGNLHCSNVNKGVAIEKNGRGAIPKMEVESNDYKYMPEDLVKNSDTKIGSLKSKFAALTAKSGGVYTAKRFTDPSFRKNTEVDDGLGGKAKFRYYITESCIWNNTSSNSEFMNGNGTVLINVTNKDIVILMEKGVSTHASGFEIVVKNDSALETQEDGSKCHKYNCYFVSDMDQNGTLKITGTNASGVSQHANSTPVNYSFEKLSVLDFDTYVRLYKPAYYRTNYVHDIGNSSSYVNKSFVFNPSNNDSLTGVYTAKPASIYFLIGEGCKLFFTNDCFIQAIVYGPQAEYSMKTGHFDMKVCDSSGYVYPESLNVCGIGMFIVEKFQSNDTHPYYIYTKPAATSALNNVKPNKDNYMNGFVLDKYDHS